LIFLSKLRNFQVVAKKLFLVGPTLFFIYADQIERRLNFSCCDFDKIFFSFRKKFGRKFRVQIYRWIWIAELIFNIFISSRDDFVKREIKTKSNLALRFQRVDKFNISTC
jgi:hypothetical protein